MQEREKKAVRALARQRKIVSVLRDGLGITGRQAEVVYCIVLCDMTTDETAAALGISVRTVNGHLENLRDQHEVSQVELVKRVCETFCGELDREMVGKGGRLRITAVARRLRIPAYLAPVLRLVWEGKGSKEIAPVLSLSLHTVANYRRKLRRKLRVSSTKALVRKVYEELTSEGFWQGSERVTPRDE